MAEGEYSCDFYVIHRVENILLIAFIGFKELVFLRLCVVSAPVGTVKFRPLLSPLSPS